MERQSIICMQRGKIYEMLSSCFLNAPSEDIFKLIEEGREDFNELLRGYDHLSHDFHRIISQDYEQEYYDRFFVPTSSLFVPPYESAIRNLRREENKIRYGKLDSAETFHVKACYEMVSFKPEKLQAFEPLREIQFSDHLAFELAFMAYLAFSQEKALKAMEKKNSENWHSLQIQFLKEHLDKWIGEYALLAKKKGEGLYSYLAAVSAAWIKEDLNFLLESMN